jgi:hypothetical protein
MPACNQSGRVRYKRAEGHVRLKCGVYVHGHKCLIIFKRNNRNFSPVVSFKTSRIIGVSGSEVLSEFKRIRRDNNGY